MGRTKINVKINSREDAARILGEFNGNDKYLKSLIWVYVPGINGSYVDSMDRSKLLHYGNVIRAVAQRIVNTSTDKTETEDLESRIGTDRQMTLFR